jgi:hypothetical protein
MTALKQSWQRQKEVSKPGGLCFHSFWRGGHEEEHHGLRFTYYTEDMLTDLIDHSWEILLMDRYDEMEPDDSIYIMLRKK